jgi:hypothetical protein
MGPESLIFMPFSTSVPPCAERTQWSRHSPPTARWWSPCWTKMTPSSRICTLLCAVVFLIPKGREKMRPMGISAAPTHATHCMGR